MIRIDSHRGQAVYWLPALAWMALIFAMSSQASVALPPTFGGADLVLHAGTYAVLAGLIFLARLPFRAASWARAAVVFVLAAAYGAGDELHQSYVPGRYATIPDFMADTLGAALGALYMHWTTIAADDAADRRAEFD